MQPAAMNAGPRHRLSWLGNHALTMCCLYYQGEDGTGPKPSLLHKARCPGTKRQTACGQGLAVRPHQSAHGCPISPGGKGLLLTTVPWAESRLQVTPQALLTTSGNETAPQHTNTNGT